ncbi:MAG: hypothetical protein GXY24_03975 [Bacteroidales bacterium]|jgi:hypothetical protein|nr:hypothetical protein [Bacteroidales bacterium]
MRNLSVLFLLLGGILAACSPMDEPPSGGDRRRPDTGAGSGTFPVHDTPAPPPATPDTVLYLSAVRFPDDYDWQRDSAYGSVPFELILYRDEVPVLTLAWDAEACFSPDPDRHHLIGGHLYTERMCGGQTRVGRDGEELFRFDGREFLVGLLPDGNNVYTLSRKTSGSGFSYRKNGIVLMESGSGTPFGDLSDPSYAPTGALYRDGGALVFCYRDGAEICGVRDGKPDLLARQAPGRTFPDCKLRDGQEHLLQADLPGFHLQDGRLWIHPAGDIVTGYFTADRPWGFSGWMAMPDDTFPRLLCRKEATIYYSPEGTFAVEADAEGGVRWYGPGGSGASEVPARFFCPTCATVSGGRLVLALTPLDTAFPPHVLWGTQRREIPVNGYISALAVELSPPPAN